MACHTAGCHRLASKQLDEAIYHPSFVGKTADTVSSSRLDQLDRPRRQDEGLRVHSCLHVQDVMDENSSLHPIALHSLQDGLPGQSGEY